MRGDPRQALVQHEAARQSRTTAIGVGDPILASRLPSGLDHCLRVVDHSVAELLHRRNLASHVESPLGSAQ
jgi:hypothetical protein